MIIAVAILSKRYSLSPLLFLLFGLAFAWGNDPLTTVSMILSLAMIYAYLSKSIFKANVIYFLLTNLACWVNMYPQNLHGLFDCYLSALPFFPKALLMTYLTVKVVDLCMKKSLLVSLSRQ